jgi:hypothetical protein
VEVFNRKLRKQMKVFENTALINLDSNLQNLFTKHGLHLNNKGKKMAAKKIVSTIKYMLNKKQKNQFILLGVKIMQKKHWKTTIARNIKIKDLKKEETV